MSLQQPSTFLEIVQRTSDECGFTQAQQPASVKNQSNMQGKLVSHVTSAHTAIQDMEERWRFNWATTGGALDAGVDTYDPLARWGVDAKIFLPDRQSSYVYKPAVGLNTRQFLIFVPFERFRGLNVPQVNSTQPIYWTQKPDGTIVYWPAPSGAGWSTVHECYLNPQVMTENIDTPRMKGKHRMAIVWRAVMLFCGSQKDGDLYQHAQAEYGKVLDSMYSTELPQWLAGAPLA